MSVKNRDSYGIKATGAPLKLVSCEAVSQVNLSSKPVSGMSVQLPITTTTTSITLKRLKCLHENLKITNNVVSPLCYT